MMQRGISSLGSRENRCPSEGAGLALVSPEDVLQKKARRSRSTAKPDPLLACNRRCAWEPPPGRGLKMPRQGKAAPMASPCVGRMFALMLVMIPLLRDRTAHHQGDATGLIAEHGEKRLCQHALRIGEGLENGKVIE
jgi:hypothetical protein